MCPLHLSEDWVHYVDIVLSTCFVVNILSYIGISPIAPLCPGDPEKCKFCPKGEFRMPESSKALLYLEIALLHMTNNICMLGSRTLLNRRKYILLQ